MPQAKPPVRFDIDLIIERDAAADADEGAPFAHITAAGSEIDVRLSHPSDVMGGRPSRDNARTVADELAKSGVVVTLSGPFGIIAQIGAVRGTAAGRIATGSDRVRLGSPRAVMAALGSRAKATAVSTSLPPLQPTLFPLAPTLARRGRSRITTTHYTPGSGHPRLIFVLGSSEWDGRPPREFELMPDSTTIGSDAKCDLRLPGLDAVHAVITHTHDDEYELMMLGGPSVQVPLLEAEHPERSAHRILRTGARIELGEWRMAFFREEFADHGRPFGGRPGGEGTHQRPQPPRQNRSTRESG